MNHLLNEMDDDVKGGLFYFIFLKQTIN